MKLILRAITLMLVLGLSALIIYFLKFQDISPSAFLGIPKEIKRPDIGMSFTDIRIVRKRGNRRVVDMRAEKGFINQDSDTVDLFGVNATMSNRGSPPLQVTAEKGRYYEKTGVVTLSVNIYLIIDDNIELRTESLEWDGEKRVLTTDDFVTITNTQRSFHLTGTSMEFRPGSEEIKIKKDVSAVFF